MMNTSNPGENDRSIPANTDAGWPIEQGQALVRRYLGETDGGPLTPLPRRSYGFVEVVCWLLILGLSGYIFSSVVATQLSPAPDDLEASQQPGHLLGAQLNGKLLMFFRKVSPEAGPIVDTHELAFQGSLLERFSGVILTAEFDSPESAEHLLSQIDDEIARFEYQPTPMEQRVRGILQELLELRQRFPGFDSGQIAEDDREYLVQQMGWLGKLALTPAGGPNLATRTELEQSAMFATIGLMVAGLLFVLILLAGLVALGFFVVLSLMGRLQSRTSDHSGSGSIYLETFTLWIFLFTGLQIAAIMIGIPHGKILAVSPLLFAGSMVALFWPVVRGISPGQVAEDIGFRSRNTVADALMAIPCYVALVPLVVVAGVINLLLVMLMNTAVAEPPGRFDPIQSVAHPLQEELAVNGMLGMWMAVVAACIMAPLVEETFFRGVFYRYLRDRSERFPRWLSIGISALVSSAIFAAIHPQGILGLLVLTTLAIGLALAREWRGSLYASIGMHAINNSLVTALMLIIFRG